jgi:hypothetical protein
MLQNEELRRARVEQGNGIDELIMKENNSYSISSK